MMKKKYLKLFTLIGFILIGASCHKKETYKSPGPVKQEDTIRSTPFNPALESIIKDFISFAPEGKIAKTHRTFYILFFYEEENSCYAAITTSLSFDEEKIKGYIFMDGKLIIYYGDFSNRCSDLFINKTNLLQFNDSIPGYMNSSQSKIIIFHEPVRRIYKITDENKLSLISEGFY